MTHHSTSAAPQTLLVAVLTDHAGLILEQTTTGGKEGHWSVLLRQDEAPPTGPTHLLSLASSTKEQSCTQRPRYSKLRQPSH